MYSHKKHSKELNKTYKLTKAQQLPNTSTHQLTNSKSHKLINLRTNELIKPRTYKLINSPTQKLKILFFTLQYRSNFRSILAKVLVKK